MAVYLPDGEIALSKNEPQMLDFIQVVAATSPVSAETVDEMFLRIESWKHDFKVQYNPSE